MTKTKYNITEAHRITGKSRTTISKHIKSSRLSCERDESGKPYIDASELIRVYGDDCNFDLVNGNTEGSGASQAATVQPVNRELVSVQQQLDTERQERERERRQLQEQIEHLQDTLKLVQESHSKAMLLLENHNSGGDRWQRLEEKIAEQESTFLRRVGELEKEAKQEAITEIKNQPWWRLAFR